MVAARAETTAGYGVVGASAEGVIATGVAVVLAEVREHRLDDGGVDRRGGVVVEIDWFHVLVRSRQIFISRP